MRKKLMYYTAIICLLILGTANVRAGNTNPVIPGDCADPSIIKVGDTYYATGTSSEWAPHFPLFTSKDMITWKQVGYIFNTKPAWTGSSFWAPELFYHNNTFYVYYVARRKSDNISCIGVATSKDPLKGFTDHGVIIEHGKEAIDAYILNDNGTLYMTFKAYGLDKRPIEILACKLSPDGLKREGDYFSLLRDDARQGLEGQVLMKWNNHYYLFYSAGGCCGLGCSYNVRVARAATIQGPYTNYESNPILAEGEAWKCPGHGTFVQTDANKYFYLYHAYSKKDDVYTGRQALLDELVWNEYIGWPQFKNGKSPSVQAPGSNAAYAASSSIRDDFNTAKLPIYWQWDFRHTTPVTKITKGTLYLSGNADTSNHTGTAITVRPVSGDYELNTEVVNSNASLKGLTLYGDANQSVGIGVTNDKVQVWEVKKNRKHILTEAAISKKPIRLRMQVEAGYQCRFFWSQDGNQWNELKAGDQSYYDGRHLPPWDRSPRPGLLHFGSNTAPAAFSFFSITYKN
ncbi:MAG: family 43 glycosylhydrolase [Niastella sp.]|nr:family 43 glycosylhydrolase [Niastella sp.]